jgi:hypothetical protein
MSGLLRRAIICGSHYHGLDLDIRMEIVSFAFEKNHRFFVFRRVAPD